jgi:hypothetical protein
VETLPAHSIPQCAILPHGTVPRMADRAQSAVFPNPPFPLFPGTARVMVDEAGLIARRPALDS